MRTVEPSQDEPLRRSVGADDEGRRLDVFLAAQPEVASRSLAKELIKSGAVRVDERPAKPGVSLEAGQVVSFVPRIESEAEPPPIPEFDLPVIHEDRYLLVIDKPAGIAAHPPERPQGWSGLDVASIAQRRCGALPTVAGPDRPGIVHRLDKDTSGVMVLAKTEEAFHFVKSQFKARTVRKEYRAICYGDPRFDSDHIERPIAAHPRHDRMTTVAQGGREASTFYEVLERFGDVCHVRCRPRTGRTHQIRVHMASIGHPLVGDRVYKRHRAVDEPPTGAPDLGRHALHARSIALQHPRTHEETMFEAPLPRDMEALLAWLRRRQRGGR